MWNIIEWVIAIPLGIALAIVISFCAYKLEQFCKSLWTWR